MDNQELGMRGTLYSSLKRFLEEKSVQNICQVPDMDSYFTISINSRGLTEIRPLGSGLFYQPLRDDCAFFSRILYLFESTRSFKRGRRVLEK